MTIDMVNALNMALNHAMKNDKNIVLFGEDIGHLGGVFRVTYGLQKQFGTKRVIDTPISEALLAGMPVGLCAQKLRPIVEFQFMGFSYSGIDQIFNHISRICFRTFGRIKCPVVFRMPYGAGTRAPEHHSDSTEALYAAIPGISVVVPSTPQQAYRLLLGAIQHPDPVIFLEPTRLYRTQKETFDTDGSPAPLGKAHIVHLGTDVTLIAWGAICHDMKVIVDDCASKNISIELIDLQTIKPFDFDAIAQSVQKTGRCVIVHEANGMCGIGAEIAAQLAENMLMYLHAPIRRVTGQDMHRPYYLREHEHLPGKQYVMNAINDVLGY